MTAVEFRCPVTPRRLFAQLHAGSVTVDRGDNTLVMACDDCRTALRRMGESDVIRVLHKFNLLGECIETIKQRSIPISRRPDAIL
jgi:hypothetical protein